MRIALLLVWLSYALHAGVVNAVAVVVDGTPITLYEIDELSQQMEISPAEARKVLIDKALQDNEIKRLGISVADYEVEERMAAIAGSNRLSITQFQQMLESRFVSLESYTNSLKEKMLQEKLARKIFSDEHIAVDIQDAKFYYENNQAEFMVPKSISVTKYAASSQTALQRYLQNPLMMSAAIHSEDETFNTDGMAPQLLALLSGHKEGEFTTILPIREDLFISFYIHKKDDPVLQPFDTVKTEVLAKLKSENEQKSITRYLIKKRASAEITELR